MSDQKPQEKGWYLTYTQYGCCVNVFIEDGIWGHLNEYVTHWMPLPPLPEDEEVNSSK